MPSSGVSANSFAFGHSSGVSAFSTASGHSSGVSAHFERPHAIIYSIGIPSGVPHSDADGKHSEALGFVYMCIYVWDWHHFLCRLLPLGFLRPVLTVTRDFVKSWCDSNLTCNVCCGGVIHGLRARSWPMLINPTIISLGGELRANRYGPRLCIFYVCQLCLGISSSRIKADYVDLGICVGFVCITIVLWNNRPSVRGIAAKICLVAHVQPDLTCIQCILA